MATVYVEPLAIGSEDSPRVWLVTRRVGGHLDVEQCPDAVTDEDEARLFASRLWRVRVADVGVRPAQVINLGEEPC